MKSEHSNLILAQRCMYLLLFDSKGLDWKLIPGAGPYDRTRFIPPPDLFDYASEYWPKNFDSSYLDDDTVGLWHDVCDTSSHRFDRWYSRYKNRNHRFLFVQYKNRFSSDLQSNSGLFNKLVLAIIFRHEHLVKMLVKADLGFNLRGHNGWAMLSLAIKVRSPAIINILLNRGAQANVRDDSGRGFLHYMFRLSLTTYLGMFLAGRLGIDPVFPCLRKANREVEFVLEGWTLLHLIAFRDIPLEKKNESMKGAIIHSLLKAGADPNARDWQGQKPLQLFFPDQGKRDSEAYQILKRFTSRNVLLESKFLYNHSIIVIIIVFEWLALWGVLSFIQMCAFSSLALLLWSPRRSPKTVRRRHHRRQPIRRNADGVPSRTYPIS